MGVMRAAITVGLCTFFSRVVGFLRECTMAFCLGAGVCTDALLVALRLANTFRRIFAEGAFNSSFLPRFSKTLNREGKESANIVLSNIFLALTVMITAFCIVVLIFMPNILRVILSGFDASSEKFRLSLTLSRISFFYLLFISLASLFAGVLNTVNKFALPAAANAILNVFTMSAMLIGYFLGCSSKTTVHIVAVFALFSGIVHTYLLYYAVKKTGFIVTLHRRFWTDKVRDILKNMIPGIIGAGVWQLSILVDTTVCSYLPAGTITCMSLADRLNQFPLGTLGIALSTALLPALSNHVAKENYEDAAKDLQRGLMLALFLTFLAATFLITLNEPTVAVAFQRGLFGADRVKITADALVGFAIGLPAYILTKVFSTVYFSCGDTKTPVVLGAISILLNAIFIVILVPFFKYRGLALGTSLSAVSNAIMLWFFCNKNMKAAIGNEFYSRESNSTVRLLRNDFQCTIFAQLCASAVTYECASALKVALWTEAMGDSAIKWPVYCLMSAAVFIIFASTVMLILKILGSKKWKLWKREAWMS